jgi:hypothetical protein
MSGHPNEQILNMYLDAELSTDERKHIDTHLASCDACRAEMQALQELFTALEELALAPEPAPDLTPGVLAYVHPCHKPVALWLVPALQGAIALALLAWGWTRLTDCWALARDFLPLDALRDTQAVLSAQVTVYWATLSGWMMAQLMALIARSGALWNGLREWALWVSTFGNLHLSLAQLAVLGVSLVVFFLAPMIGELLSGSAPPAEFFDPFGLFLMAALYGSGAILIRELRVRWGKGWWPVVLILGAAYGIVEEGLACKSFFDPGWPDLGQLGSYGRWLGVNWVWSLNLTIYYMVFSIVIPILLVELLFPTRRDERWVGRKGMVGFSLLLVADVLFCFAAFPYRPPLLHVLLTIAVVVALYWIARDCQRSTPRPAPRASLDRCGLHASALPLPWVSTFLC